MVHGRPLVHNADTRGVVDNLVLRRIKQVLCRVVLSWSRIPSVARGDQQRERRTGRGVDPSRRTQMTWLGGRSHLGSHRQSPGRGVRWAAPRTSQPAPGPNPRAWGGIQNMCHHLHNPTQPSRTEPIKASGQSREGLTCTRVRVGRVSRVHGSE